MTASPFQVRGLIEGFYGTFYTHPERLRLLRFLGERGYNLYIYAPKNDRQHRARWREAYPGAIMRQFKEAASVAREAGVEFCYSLSPGFDMSYASEEDFGALKRKLASFYEIGVRSFSLLLDDIRPDFRTDADRTRFGSYAEAHAELCNRTRSWLEEEYGPTPLSMCPTDYHGTAPFGPYLHELGEKLHPEIDIFYTGPKVCSTTIGVADADAFGQVARRQPIIWDNYPVNDMAAGRDMNLGAIRGRDPALPGHVRGFVVNPMNQAEASKVALATFADFFSEPAGYRSQPSWEAAIEAVAGPDSAWALRLFAEHSRRSCLHEPEAEALQHLGTSALGALEDGQTGATAAATALRAYMTELDEACYHLKFRMENLALRNELVPWVELTEHWLWAARYALDAALGQEGEVEIDNPVELARAFYEKARCHPKRTGGEVLAHLVEFVLQRAAVEAA